MLRAKIISMKVSRLLQNMFVRVVVILTVLLLSFCILLAILFQAKYVPDTAVFYNQNVVRIVLTLATLAVVIFSVYFVKLQVTSKTIAALLIISAVVQLLVVLSFLYYPQMIRNILKHFR